MHHYRYHATDGFSKKLANHRAAIALHVAHYNLCRWHESIRCTPAMALGVTDHIWTIGGLIEAALAAPQPAPLVPEPHRGMSAAKAKGDTHPAFGRKLRVIRGGRR